LWKNLVFTSLVRGSPHEQFGDCVSPTSTGRLFRDPSLCGGGSTKTMNSEEDQSLCDTVAWLVTKVDCQSSFYCVFMSKGGKSDQTGCPDESTNWPVLMAVCFGQHLIHGWLPTQVWWMNVSQHWQPLVCVGCRHPEDGT